MTDMRVCTHDSGLGLAIFGNLDLWQCSWGCDSYIISERDKNKLTRDIAIVATVQQALVDIGKPELINQLCPVCFGKHGQDYISLCDHCRKDLKDCPACDSDDIEFEWRINLNDLHTIQWYCQCGNCEFEFVGDADSAKEVFENWQIEENKKAAEDTAA